MAAICYYVSRHVVYFREVIQMHLLRFVLMAWSTLGVVSVFFLFWLCKRTAATVMDPSGLISFSPEPADNQPGEVHAA